MIYLEEREFMDEFTELEYSLILIETELYSDLFNSYESITESSGLVYIEESIKETIIRYLNKIITSLQKAWETLMAGIAQGFTKNDIAKLKSLNLTDEQLGSTIIDNFPIYDDSKINSIKLFTFDYEAMKQFLKDEKTYIGKYYNEIAPKDGEKLKDTMFKYCLVERKDEFRMTREDLDNIIGYLDNYKNELKTVQEDLDKINGSSKAIDQMVTNSTENTTVNDLKPENTTTTQATTTTTQTATNTQQSGKVESFELDSMEDAISLLESFFILNEAPTVQTNPPVPQTGAGAGSMASDQQRKKEQEKQNNQEVKITQDKVTKADKNSQVVKDVQVYMSASTKVLVAKMRLLRVRFRNYIKIARTILNKYDKDARKRQNEGENQPKTNTELQQINTR